MANSKELRERKTLTDILRESFKGIIDPIVSLLAHIGVTPNMLTVLGMLMHIPVAYFIIIGEFRWAVVAGIFSTLDALDGSLARKLSRGHGGSGFGAFLDSTLDRIAETILFSGLVYYFAVQGEPIFVTISYAALCGSLLVSYTRSRAEALGYSCKIGLFTRVERYLVLFVFGLSNQPEWAVVVMAVGTWITVVQRMVHVWRQATA